MAKKLSTSTLLFTLVPLVLVAVVGLAVYQGNKPSIYDGLAQCLTEKGVVMYGAWWCPNCENQKADFGTAFEHVANVECSPNQTRTQSIECQNAGIQSYPTWRFPEGEDMVGRRPLADIAARAGCELPQDA